MTLEQVPSLKPEVERFQLKWEKNKLAPNPLSPEADFFIKKSLTDDIFIGSSSMEHLKQLATVITEGLFKANFRLKKWVFSGEASESRSIGDCPDVGCLGLMWNPLQDFWKLNIHLNVSVFMDEEMCQYWRSSYCS